jgi:hypothetical protein
MGDRIPAGIGNCRNAVHQTSWTGALAVLGELPPLNFLQARESESRQVADADSYRLRIHRALQLVLLAHH